MVLQGDQRRASKRAKIADDEEELLCWPGPTPPPQSPVRCDCPIKVTEHVIQIPEQGIRAAMSIEDARNPTLGVRSRNMEPDAKQETHSTDVDDFEDTEECQFTDFHKPAHIQI